MDEEWQELTLENAIEGMNRNAKAMEDTASLLRTARSTNEELVDLFEVATCLISALKQKLAKRCGRSPLTDAAEAFISGTEEVKYLTRQ